MLGFLGGLIKPLLGSLGGSILGKVGDWASGLFKSKIPQMVTPWMKRKIDPNFNFNIPGRSSNDFDHPDVQKEIADQKQFANETGHSLGFLGGSKNPYPGSNGKVYNAPMDPYQRYKTHLSNQFSRYVDEMHGKLPYPGVNAGTVDTYKARRQLQPVQNGQNVGDVYRRQPLAIEAAPMDIADPGSNVERRTGMAAMDGSNAYY